MTVSPFVSLAVGALGMGALLVSALMWWRARRRTGLPDGLQWAALASATDAWFWATDLEGRLKFLSDPAEAAMADAWQGRPLADCVAADQRQALSRELGAVAQGGPLADYQVTQLLPSGDTRELSLSARRWTDRTGRTVGVLGSASDVSAHMAATRELDALRRRLDSLLMQLPLFYFRLDSEARLQEVTGRGALCLHQDPARLVGESAYALFPGAAEAIDRALGGRESRFESQGISRDRLWWVSICLLPGDDGGVAGLGIDVTESKTAEVKMVGLIRENRALARRLVEIQEEERNMLSRELHDELGQSLTAVRTLATAIANSRHRDPQEISSLGSSIVDLSARLYDVVRNLMHRLRPDVVDGLRFDEALQTCIDNAQLEAMGIQLDVVIDPDLDDLNDVLKISLYRILQESLTNIAKYAMASHVTVRLARRRPVLSDDAPGAAPGQASDQRCDCIDLTITDDGVGLEGGDQGDARRGSGLRGIRERVHALGGDVNIVSAPGKGVSIHVSVDASVAGQVDGGRPIVAS
jgi:signal transduction histidine kinase